VLAADPDIAQPRHRRLRDSGTASSSVLPSVLVSSPAMISSNWSASKPVSARSKSSSFNSASSRRSRSSSQPRFRAVGQQIERLDLRRRQVVGRITGTVSRPELACRLQAQVAGDEAPIGLERHKGSVKPNSWIAAAIWSTCMIVLASGHCARTRSAGRSATAQSCQHRSCSSSALARRPRQRSGRSPSRSPARREVLLEALDRHIDVLGSDLDRAGDAAGTLRREHRRARTAEGVEDDVAKVGVGIRG
jgi:hypothetical protein